MNRRVYKITSVATLVLVLALVLGSILLPSVLVKAAGNLSITRQYSPTANAAITLNAGNNNGFETTPAYAYADGGSGSATDKNSGLAANSVATGTGTDKHNFYNYGFTEIPSGSTISGITARADIAVSSLTNSPFTALRLSYDGGTTWTTVKQTPLTATAETTYTYGGSADLWGYAWATAQLTDANFRLQVINGDTKDATSNCNFSLDWIPASITFTAPWDSYQEVGRTTIRDAYNDSYSTVYMKGTGFAAGTYNVAYYDAAGVKVLSDNGISAVDGVLQNLIILGSYPSSSPGTWNALAQPSSYTAFPAAYSMAIASPDTYGLIANDSFGVAASAIPEFPTVMAAIVVAGACFGIYWWMRKKTRIKMQIAN